MTPAPSPSPLVVIKLGGTSVADAANWARVASAVRARLAAGERVLVVQSALAGSTNRLERLCASVDPAVHAADRAALDAAHAALATMLELGPDAIAACRAQLAIAVDAAARRGADGALAPEVRATVLAAGELAASELGVRALRRLLGTDVAGSVEWLDARELLLAERPANQAEAAGYLNAVCASDLDPALAARLALLWKMGARCALTQGYIARNAAGETVVLGRGGSDTSAAYLAARAGAAALEIWTDVPGMYTADPRLVPAARLLKQLDYAEAQEIATTGAKVLHPRCLEPVRRHGIPLAIRCTPDPDAPGTHIGPQPAEASARVKAISVRRGVTLVSMETVGMWQQVGFMADAFAVFKQHGVSIDLCSTSETCVTASLDEPATGVSAETLDALCRDLEPFCRPKLIRGCATVSIVGRGIRAILHRLAPALELLDERAVYLVSHAASDLNLTFVLEEADAERVARELHALLVPRFDAAGAEDAVLGARWDARLLPAAAAVPPWWRTRRPELLALAAERSPRYAYSAAALRAACAELGALKSIDRVLYAMKANPHPGVLAVLRAAGLGFECVSPGEIARLRECFTDLRSDELLFTPNFAPRAEYEQALAAGIPTTVDNLWALESWGACFRSRALFLRLDPGHGAGHHRHVRTAGQDSKFGITLADAPRAAARAAELGARIVGLHLHLGSGILDANAWRDAGEALAAVATLFPDAKVIDLGGGLGVPDGGAGLDLAALERHLAGLKAALPGRALWLEPGRFLVARAGVLLTRVTQLKGKGAARFVGVDAGMNSLIRPALYGAHHPIVNLTRIDAAGTQSADVVGPICESGDVLGHARALPECEEGDVLLISDAGAYGAAMSSRYNLREPADEVVLA